MKYTLTIDTQANEYTRTRFMLGVAQAALARIHQQVGEAIMSGDEAGVIADLSGTPIGHWKLETNS